MKKAKKAKKGQLCSCVSEVLMKQKWMDRIQPSSSTSHDPVSYLPSPTPISSISLFLRQVLSQVHSWSTCSSYFSPTFSAHHMLSATQNPSPLVGTDFTVRKIQIHLPPQSQYFQLQTSHKKPPVPRRGVIILKNINYTAY